jgi:uncharacterized protein (TIGR02300 family)
MPKDEWGVKRACPECSVRFYDLQKDPMVCPSCGAIFDLASLTQTRQKSAERAKPKPEVPAEKPVAEDAADILVDADDPDDPADADIGDDLLVDDDDETVSLEVIADVAKEDDD